MIPQSGHPQSLAQLTLHTYIHDRASPFLFLHRPFSGRLVSAGTERKMVEDKYIGLALAVSSSVAIGTSYIITKKVCVWGGRGRGVD